MAHRIAIAMAIAKHVAMLQNMAQTKPLHTTVVGASVRGCRASAQIQSYASKGAALGLGQGR